MSRQYFGAAAVIVGLMLLVLSFVWPWLSNPEAEWTEEDAQALQESVARAHSGAPLTDSEKERGEALFAQRDRARQRPYQIAAVLKWSGAGLVGLGAVALILSRRREA